jgi:light-regulated signal transduction histidine kinase (bacteriophytochrome)
MEADVATAIYIGEEMIIQMANDSMIRLWGKNSSVVGKPLMDALPELKGQPFSDLLTKVYKTGITYKATEDRADLVVDGQLQSFYFNFTYKALRNVDGEIYGILNMAVDVTEQVLAKRKLSDNEELLKHAVEERTKELKETNQNLLISNQELERFAHVASHDMKEPTRKIIMFIRMLEEEMGDVASPASKVLMRKILKSSERLNSIIDGVLEYSKLNATKDSNELVPLEEIIQNIESDLEVVIREKHAVLHKTDLPVIYGQRFLLFQLFYNLVSNAMKFNRPNISPVVEVSGLGEFNYNGKLYHRISVKDNGIGFDQSYAQSIFNKFTRLNSKDHFEGTGLGLSLCKAIAERHGGWIEAFGEENNGAEFLVYLPSKEI